MRVDQELNNKNRDLQDCQNTKMDLDNYINSIARDIQNARQKKLLEEETIRRTSNANQLIKNDIETKREAIENLLYNCQQITKCNDIKKDENDQLCRELEAINKHIILLEDQNKDLEQELDRFLMSDNEIRSKLRNRSRSPLQATDLYMNSNKLAEAKTMVTTYDVFRESQATQKQQQPINFYPPQHLRIKSKSRSPTDRSL